MINSIVQDIMVPLEQYSCLPETLTRRDAINEMQVQIRRRNQTSLPRVALVFDEGMSRLLGMLRRRDILRELEPSFLLSGSLEYRRKLFEVAATWWVFEVLPIGVTAMAIGVTRALFLIRPAKAAYNDFMDPSVWFIIGSIAIGMVFSKTGVTRRMAYGMLVLVGERTSMIYLGSFVITAGLILIMAHTAVAASIYPGRSPAAQTQTEDSPDPRRCDSRSLAEASVRDGWTGILPGSGTERWEGPWQSQSTSPGFV